MANPNLGYDHPSEASMNDVNQYMRSAPWYQSLIASFGQDPNNVQLNDQQKQQVIKAAQANGIVVDEGHNGQEIDDSGNFRAKGHKLRNTLLVAGIAGAALATAGLAGAFAGPAAGGLGGVEAGATSGLGAAALPGAGTALGAGAVLPSAAIGTGMAAPIVGGTGLASGAGATAVPGTLAAVGKTLSGEDLLGTVGRAVSNASSAAGNTRRADYDTNVLANNSNISGQSAFENELTKRADIERTQRSDALKNVYRSSYAQNARPGPYNAAGTAAFSPEYLKALKDLEGQGAEKLAAKPQYDSNGLPVLNPYTPIKPTQASTLEQVGNWAGPVTSTLGAIGRFFGK